MHLHSLRIKRPLAAIKAGHFDAEISPYDLVSIRRIYQADRSSAVIILSANDEGPRADTSLEGLAKLKPVFKARGSVTAGNSSQMSDGAGAVLLASEQAIKDYGLNAASAFRQLFRCRRAA